MKRHALVLIAALLLLPMTTVACGSAASTLTPAATPSPTPTDTAARTARDKATAKDTAVVTSTSTPAATLGPGATPTPTPKPTPAPTPTPKPAPVVTSGTVTILNMTGSPSMAAVPATMAVGDIVTLTATGTYGSNTDGTMTVKSVGCKAESAPGSGSFAPHLTAWAIIGRFAPDNWFCIGTGATVTVTQAGEMLVAINQHAGATIYSGIVTVKWTLSHQP